MPPAYELYWYDDEQTIVYIKYPEQWAWDDLYHMREKVIALIESSNAPRVDCIADAASTKMPQGSPFGHVKHIMSKRDPRVQLTVTVSQSQLIRTIGQVAFQLVSQGQANFQMASSIDEAVTLIMRSREGVTPKPS